MDIDRAALEIMLRRVYFEDISIDTNSGENDYKGLKKTYFLMEAKNHLLENSEDENEQLYYWIKNELNTGEGIYNYILKIAKEFVNIQKNGFYYNECNWRINSQFFHWKKLAFDLGQDIFLSVLLASTDIKKKNLKLYLCMPFAKIDNVKEKFSWEDCGKGWAENHFHVKGSFPVFLLNWVCIMNHIGNRNDYFYKFEQYREAEVLSEASYHKRKNIYQCSIIAASYRLHLYEVYNAIPQKLQMEFSYKRDFDETNINILQDRIEYYLSKVEKKWSKKQNSWIYCLDYALGEQWEECYDEDEASIAGERYFLYRCFYAILNNESCFRNEEKNLFYKYLLISFRIRSEFVQTNRMIGFQNFAIYQNRKEDIIDYFPEYQEHIIRLTGCSLRKWQNITSLEMRISPKLTACETLDKIQEYVDSMECYSSKRKKDDCFFVLHFPKEADVQIEELKPRNYLLRDRMICQIEIQKQLINLEKSLYEYTGKIPTVRGYDTCAGEIGCRPEVFAQFYRSIKKFAETNNIGWIHWTYHVGEDFLDLLDGLRAIDEVIQFCELPMKSRLGHGMALGIDVKQYYKMKHQKVLLPRQELLDNISWIMGFCQEHGIVIEKELMKDLKKKFYELIEVIYEAKIEYNLCKKKLSYDFETDKVLREVAVTNVGDVEEIELWKLYYDAWKLRGDNPYIYMNYSEEEYPVGFDETLRKDLDNIRGNKTCRNFYRRYHFDIDARERGKVPERFVVSNDYIRLIQKIQIELRECLTKKQIGIECNPTSNYKIGPFYRFEEHPMFQMYGKNLSNSSSSKMCISINTDDMGIFQTSLEMEYATLYVALLKCKDEKGDNKYCEEEICKWLEDVKIFGHEQAFKFGDKDACD